MKRERKFDKHGLLAMRADLWGMLFGAEEEKEEFEMVGNAAIVSISGPLMQHDEWWWDSYDAIKARISAALDSSAETVILKIDSPGGMVAGCFEAVREIRALADASGKKIISYADGMAASAGYALACIGDQICLPATGEVGSIGVISTMLDWTAMNRAMGLNIEVIASGKKKRYGHPDVPLSEAAVASAQAQVDQLAGLFFDLVGERRPTSSADVAALEAGTFIGTEAVSAGLADRICTFDELLAMVASGGETTAPAGASEAAMSWKDEMKKAADEGDEEAKKCLDALDKEETAETTDDKEPPPAKEDDKATAEETPKEEEKEKAAARGARPVAKSIEQRIAAIEEESERDQLYAKRPDLMRDPGMRKKMQSAPIAALRWNVENLSKVAAPPAPAAAHQTSPIAHAAANTPAGTRGKDEVGGTAMSRRSERADELDEKMGFAKDKPHVVHQGNVTSIRVMTPSQARAHLKTLDANVAAGGK